MAGVTAMAAGGEQIPSAHACDVSLGARIGREHGHHITLTMLTGTKPIDAAGSLYID